uniref:alpha-1,2-Mannosidase n=1 Tax=Coturnix japonica TaxID=93934 RepID=A0A8C2UHS3_COTJA
MHLPVVGGLLSAHLLSKKAGVEVEVGWPCSGPLLRMAEEAARKLLPAFQTPTGMPYGTVNLLHGVNPGETPVTCTAGIGTFIVEFATLSHLTGDPVFEDVARKALKALWKNRSDIGLVGNHIDVVTAKWVAQDAGIGAGVDSYFEYLVKGAILLQDKELMAMFLGKQVCLFSLVLKGPRNVPLYSPVKVSLWEYKANKFHLGLFPVSLL